jgi:hypothetical protein
MFPPHKRIPPLGPAKLSPRGRALASWRGIDLSASEIARQIRAKPAGDVLSRVLSDLRIDTRRAEAEIVKVWNNLLDPAIVAHAQGNALRERGQQRVAGGNRPLPPQGNPRPPPAQLRPGPDCTDFV